MNKSVYDELIKFEIEKGLLEALRGRDGRSLEVIGADLDKEGNIIIKFSDNSYVTIPRGQRGEGGEASAKGEAGQSITILSQRVKDGNILVKFSDETTLTIPKGQDGRDGVNGTNGLSAYELAKNSGFTGTIEEWLKLLKGEDDAKGERGEQGIQGKAGRDGQKGDIINLWAGTNDEYDALSSISSTTLYLITY
ncbi:hypothetical protein ACFZL0_002605 [Staphylococcus pseudintermedius]